VFQSDFKVLIDKKGEWKELFRERQVDVQMRKCANEEKG